MKCRSRELASLEPGQEVTRIRVRRGRFLGVSSPPGLALFEPLYPSGPGEPVEVEDRELFATHGRPAEVLAPGDHALWIEDLRVAWGFYRGAAPGGAALFEPDDDEPWLQARAGDAVEVDPSSLFRCPEGRAS